MLSSLSTATRQSAYRKKKSNWYIRRFKMKTYDLVSIVFYLVVAALVLAVIRAAIA